MGNVTISPNIKKESVRINTSGDVINPRTKEVVVENKPEYVPTPEEVSKTVAPAPVITKENPLATAIKAQVQKAVQEQIASIDISKMVSDAIKESFK